MPNKLRTKRVDGYLHRVVTIKDDDNKDHTVLVPFAIEFRPRDFLQVLVGATLIATPVAFTEEVWNLGETLPILNVFLLTLISFSFVSLFVYFNFYRYHFIGNVKGYLKRVFLIYGGSIFVCMLLLILIDKVDIQNIFDIGLKRVLLVSFPASMSASISDTIK